MAEQLKGKATASLVLGIICTAAGLFFGGWLKILGLACGIVGLVLGNDVKKECVAAGEEAPSTAKAGVVLSVIGIILCVIMFVIVLTCASAIGCAILR